MVQVVKLRKGGTWWDWQLSYRRVGPVGAGSQYKEGKDLVGQTVKLKNMELGGVGSQANEGLELAVKKSVGPGGTGIKAKGAQGTAF